MATSTQAPTINTSTNPADYYSTALSLIQPTVNAEVAPLKQEQQNIPTLYANKQKSLTDQSQNISSLYDSIIKGNTNQANISKEIIGEDNTAQQGQQRANAAAGGISSSSGVEQSQESNIANRTALRLAQIDQTTQDKNTTLGIQEGGQVQQISDEIAALPSQEAQDMLSVGAQIAGVQGKGAMAAFSYASSMASLAADTAYKDAELAIQQENVDLAQEKITQAASFHQDSVALQQSAQRIQTAPKQTTSTTPRQGVLGGVMNWLFGSPTKKSTSTVGGWQ